MSICLSISWATALYGTFKQNIYEDETRLCFINYVLLPVPVLFLRAQPMFRPLLHWKNTHSAFSTKFSLFGAKKNLNFLSLLPRLPLTLSVQFSRSVMSDSLRPHEPHHTRPPCPSPTPEVHPNPCPLSWWCHPTISSSVIPFSSCPQSFPASGSFQMSQLCTSGGQGIGVSESITLCNWTFISITILKISQRLLMMADLMVKSNSFLSSCPPPLATVYNIYLCALFLKYFCPGVSGIWYWPALPSLFSSLSSEVSCLLATSWFCVCFIVWFPPIILSSSEDCIQSHGFNLKPNLEIRSARSLPTHTLYKLF